MAEPAPASATTSAASGGRAPEGTPLRRLLPSVALLIGLLLTAGTALLFWSVTAADPGRACGGRGLPALALSGTDQRAMSILACDGNGFPVKAARSAIARDMALIPSYVLTLGFWCWYGGLRARRKTTQRALYGVIALIVAAGALDVVENAILGSLLDGEQAPATLPAPQIHWLFGVSLAKLVLLGPGVIAALVILLGTVSRVARTVWGSGSWPVFIGSFPRFAEPSRPPPSLLEDPAAAGNAQHRHPPPPSPHSDPHEAAAAASPEAEVPVPVKGVGICVSGGGIRAASVTLGALRALAGAGIYQRASYLASVSGGGYAATASQVVASFDQSRRVLRDGAWHRPPRPPFDPQGPRGDDAPETEWVVARARFLWPPVELGRVPSTRAFLSAAAVGLFGIFFNVALILALVYGAVVPLGWLARLLYLDPDQGVVERTTFAGGWIALGLIVVGLGPLVGVFLWGFLGRFQVAETRSDKRLRGAAPRIVLVVVLVVAGFALVGLVLRYGLPASSWWSEHPWWLRGLFVLGALALAAVLAFVLDRSTRALPAIVVLFGLVVLAANWLESAIVLGWSDETSWRGLTTVWAFAGGIAAFLVAAACSRLLVANRSPITFVVSLGLSAVVGVAGGIAIGWSLAGWANEAVLGPAWVVYLAVLGLLLAVYALLDQKRWSPHPVYKRRLASTFSPIRSWRWKRDEQTGREGYEHEVSQLPYATRTTLSQWMQPVAGHPKLLICAAVYDTRRATGGMRAFPFVFSCDYVGGADIGWARTVDFEATLGRSNAPDGTLLAAMAISGAAVSAGFGQTDLGTLNIVLALLNARLGVWLPSPSYINELRNAKGDWVSREGPALRWIRVRRATYLVKEVLGIHDPDDRFLYVTDGGQFDNLGLIELLSRRCRLIICIDASGDNKRKKPPNTAAFDEAVRLAKVRYGIRFVPLGRAQPLEPDPEADSGPLAQLLMTPYDTTLSEDSRVHALAGRVMGGSVVELEIHYPPRDNGQQEIGRLIFAKAVLTADAPPGVLQFAAGSKHFPNHSTADQFLERVQVENYVLLGEHLGKGAADRATAFLDDHRFD